ncbi:MAG: hypothetical protein RLY86_581, partial [Pseudomonadota bacterium]
AIPPLDNPTAAVYLIKGQEEHQD